MQIVLHAGVHNTDEDRLLKCLLKNRDKLREDGVCVPGPSRYRRLLRNPASLLPALSQQLPGTTFAQFLGQTDPRQLRWGEMVARLRQAVPDVAITLWCNEDTPLIWGQIVREIAGMDHNAMIVGGMDLLAEIMAPDGYRRFRTYLKDHPEMTEIQRRRVIAAFLDKYALPEQIEDTVDVPGWTPQLIADLTDIYDEDVFQLSTIQGVQMITP
jgi:hypothetical protein